MRPRSPDPTPGSVTYSIDLDAPSDVRVRLYDVQGRLLEELLRQRLPADRHRFEWSPNRRTRPASGTYYLRLETSDRVETRRFTIVR